MSSLSENTSYNLGAELNFARHKFPSNQHLLAALMEEVGELAQALIEHSRGKVDGAKIYGEAIQVATVALRIAEEGSAEFSYKYDHAYYQAFPVGAERLIRKP